MAPKGPKPFNVVPRELVVAGANQPCVISWYEYDQPVIQTLIQTTFVQVHGVQGVPVQRNMVKFWNTQYYIAYGSRGFPKRVQVNGQSYNITVAGGNNDKREKYSKEKRVCYSTIFNDSRQANKVLNLYHGGGTGGRAAELTRRTQIRQHFPNTTSTPKTPNYICREHHAKVDNIEPTFLFSSGKKRKHY